MDRSIELKLGFNYEKERKKKKKRTRNEKEGKMEQQSVIKASFLNNNNLKLDLIMKIQIRRRIRCLIIAKEA